MPVYEYRCNVCGRNAAFFYKTYKEYDAATSGNTQVCPHCGSQALTRLISNVAIAKPSRDYSKMSSNEMLSVMNGGDGRELGTMMQQLGQDQVVNDPAFADATQRLLKGEDPGRIEADLSDRQKSASTTPPPSAPATSSGDSTT